MHSIEMTSATTDIISQFTCQRCKLATADKVPDPASAWVGRMKAKPRIDGFRCHASRPSQAGFPAVTAGQFCVYFTDGEGNQPLRHLVSEAVMKAEVDA